MNHHLRMRQEIFLQLLLVLMDIVGIVIAFGLAYWIRFYSGVIPVLYGPPNQADYLNALGLTLVFWEFLFIYNGLYIIRGKKISYHTIYQIARCAVIGMFFLMAFVFMFRNLNLSRQVVILGMFFSIPLITLERFLFSILLHYLRKKGWGMTRTLIVGTGKMAKLIADNMKNHPESGYQFCGYVTIPYSEANAALNQDIVGNLEDLSKIIRLQAIDKVLIASPELDRNLIFEVLLEVEKNIADFAVVPNLVEMMIQKVSIDDIQGIPLLSLRETPLKGWKMVFKYSFDRIIAFLALIILAPLFLLLALIIRFDTPGPIFYRQRRIGADGKQFVIYKFRSMRSDAEEDTGPIWAHKNDPRSTKVGRFIRHYYIDELPQFLNVLRGDMSLVGPRPERPFFVSQFKERIPQYMSRHRVKSGITGWAQVNGYRGDTSIEERTKYDLYYVENWDFLFDIKILLMTVFSLKPSEE